MPSKPGQTDPDYYQPGLYRDLMPSASLSSRARCSSITCFSRQPEPLKKEATETATESEAEPLQITDSPNPPRDPEGARERDRLEKERMEKCWMGADWRERHVMDEHRAREERLKNLGK